MVDISSQNNKVNITVSSSGNTTNVNATPDYTKYYSDKSKEWAISDKIVDNTDYSSKYYANESKKQADISTAKTTEVIESGNNAVSNIENARDNAITDITNQENLSVDNVNTAGATQINLAKEQVTLATNQANIAKEQATISTSQASIATSKTTEVVESGNTALSNIETAKSNALNDINTTGAEYVNNAEQYAQNALNSATNAKTSEDNVLSYKNSAMESSQTATEQASIATTSANKAITSATNAKTSETNAKSSETRCEEILSRLGTAIKIKGRVNSLGDLPLSGNLDGDTYLVGSEGLDSYPEYYWYQDHWEFMGTTTSLTWGSIIGDITNQSDLQTELNKKEDIIVDLDTIRAGAELGATALQEETDPVYTADKPNLATKAEVTAKQDKLTVGEGIKLENNTISSTVQGLPIGTIIPVNATSNYVPDGCLPCDGAEYSKSQFSDLWDNYLNELGKSIYNINGDVNINNKGIANNFSSNNYVTTPVSFTLTPESNFYYKIRIKLYKSAENSNGGWRCISAFYYGDSYKTNDLSLGYYCTDNSIGFNFRLKKDDNSYGYNIVSLYVNDYCNEGDWVTVEYIKTGTTFTIKVTNDFGEMHEKTTENISVKTNTYTLARIGKGNDGSSDFYLSDIDLSSVFIKVDNTTIFDGNKFYILLPTCTYTEYEQDLSTYGQCAKFAVDIANNKFRVPLIKDGSVIQQALTNSELGKSYNAGLPNITGSAGMGESTSATGAFQYEGGSASTGKTGTGGSTDCGFSFDASRSNPIYGNSTTVQPNAVALRYFVVVANGQINQSMMDWSAWASSLQGKANTDLSNLSDSGKKVIDGQWVSKTETLSTATAVGTYTIDLSSYLPNDNYNYEVMLHVYQASGTNSSDSVQRLYIDNKLMVSTSVNGIWADNDFINIIKNNSRIVTIERIGHKSSAFNFVANGYRRIGTNE